MAFLAGGITVLVFLPSLVHRDYVAAGQMGPRFFPRIIAIGIVCLSLEILAGSVVSAIVPLSGTPLGIGAVALCGLVTAFPILLAYLGFPISAALLGIGVMLAYGERRVPAFLLPVGAALVVTVSAVRFLHIPLP